MSEGAMVMIRARLTIREDGRDALLRDVQVLVEATLREEGCLGFGCYEAIGARNHFAVWGECAVRLLPSPQLDERLVCA